MPRTARTARVFALLVASLAVAPIASAQINAASTAANPFAQAYASDAGHGGTLNPNDVLKASVSATDVGTYWQSASPSSAWWYVDLGQNFDISSLTFMNMVGNAGRRTNGAELQLWSSVPDFVNGTAVFTTILDGSAVQTFSVPNAIARFASIEAPARRDSYLNFTSLEVDGIAVTATPEPASMALVATGLLGMFGIARRKRSK
jgi:hypothetical protein